MTSTTSPSLFAQLAKLGKREIVDLSGAKVEVVEMSFGERSKLAEMHASSKDREESVGIRYMRILLYCCCYEPGTSTRAFASEDAVDGLPQAVALALFEHAKRVNGLIPPPPLEPDPDADEPIHEPGEAEKNA